MIVKIERDYARRAFRFVGPEGQHFHVGFNGPDRVRFPCPSCDKYHGETWEREPFAFGKSTLVCYGCKAEVPDCRLVVTIDQMHESQGILARMFMDLWNVEPLAAIVGAADLIETITLLSGESAMRMTDPHNDDLPIMVSEFRIGEGEQVLV